MKRRYDYRRDKYLSLVPPNRRKEYEGIAFGFKNTAHAVRMFAGEEWGFMYSGTSLGQPTVRKFEEAMTAGEADKHAAKFDTIATASGMSALHLFYLHMRLMTGKNEIILCPAVYGGVYHHLVDHLQEACGFVVHVMTDLLHPENWASYVNKRTIGIHIETPSNPQGLVFDIAGTAWVARKMNTMLIVDNTICTYALQKPILLGAHAVINSVTKAINGKSLALGGTITAQKEIVSELRAGMGAGIRPVMDARVAKIMLEGLKDLPERMRRYSENALELAEWLSRQGGIRRVLHPQLNGPRSRELVERQMSKGCGGLFAFEVAGGERAAWKTIDALKRVIHAPHIGHTKTLAVHPRTTTHSKVPPKMQDMLGITPGLIRVSSGIESRKELQEIKKDFDSALKKAHKQ